ncbi:MAG TPA: hypothetical protein VGI03_07215 [Verrucomicrobiae bacterium]
MALFVAISVSVAFFYMVHQWAATNGHNTITPFIFTGMVDGVHSDHFAKLRLPWKPRVGGMWMTAELLKHFKPSSLEDYKDIFGAYNASWFFGTLILLIIYLKEPIFPILATFGGTIYSIQVTTYNSFYDDVHILPWDFPAMFFFTLSFLWWTRKWYWPMTVAIILGTLFKETVGVAALLIFFTGIARRRQIEFFATAFLGCLAMRLFITHFVLGQPTTFTAEHRAFGALWESMTGFTTWEFHPHLNTILWVNGGLAFAVFLLPRNSPEDWGINFILVVFYVGLVVAGIFADGHMEARHWTDVLPMLVIYFQRKLVAPVPIGHEASGNFPSSGAQKLKAARPG